MIPFWVWKWFVAADGMAWFWWMLTHDDDGTFVGAVGWTLRLFGGTALVVILAMIVSTFGHRAWMARIEQRRRDDAIRWRDRPPWKARPTAGRIVIEPRPDPTPVDAEP